VGFDCFISCVDVCMYCIVDFVIWVFVKFDNLTEICDSFIVFFLMNRLYMCVCVCVYWRFCDIFLCWILVVLGFSMCLFVTTSKFQSFMA